ncbi:hypothetical protein PS655_05283 [Pseudomonas fluorescens]|uniref:Uncharacterized protein n=1 Tax=Pseudomonas fluorescens TaxID=294 RepID=A0A5E6XBD9_PSEFL|nr:hypothetical protein PS655_05283 [Pseudomonas fluorescens]
MAPEISTPAIGEIHRVASPRRTPWCGAGFIDAEGQQGVVAHVGFEDAVEQVFALAVVIQVRVLIGIGTDETSAHVARFSQRTGNITDGAVGIPRTNGAADRGFELFGRLLADQVDRGRRIAGTGHQAGRAFDDFDAIDARGVVAIVWVLAVHAVVGDVDAVVLEVGDRQAAGGKFSTVAVVLLHGYAGGIAQGIADTLHAAIVHLLTGNHRHRLRCFADRQRQAGGRGHGAGSVGTGVFGGSAEALGGNIGGAELQGLLGFFSGVGRNAQQGQCQRAQGKTETDVRHGDPFASNRSVVEVLLRG